LTDDLVAFSNSKGGKILIGVDDDGVMVGLSRDDVRRINQLLSNTATNQVRPAINPETEYVAISNGRVVMVVTVAGGISKPYSDNNGVFWMKSGADKRRVTSREEVQCMLQSADLVPADEVPVDGTTTADIDAVHFASFFEKQYGESLDRALERDDSRLCNC